MTICTNGKACVFGEIKDDNIALSEIGKVVHEHWMDVPKHFPSVELDDFVIMPNHFHGIIILNEPRKGETPEKQIRTGEAPEMRMRRGEVSSPLEGKETSRKQTGDETSPPRNVTLGKVIGYFKYQSTKAINEKHGTPGVKLWQRSYYEHIIRNDADLMRIRTYIANNPLRWALDEENPATSRENANSSTAR